MSSISEPLSILDLSDDCLYQITLYLNVAEKIKLGLSCNKLDDIIERCLRNNPLRRSEIEREFKKDQIQCIFQKYGHSIRSLYMDVPTCRTPDEYSEQVGNYCKDLEEFQCHCSRKADETLWIRLISASARLRSCELSSWAYSDEVDFDNISFELSNLTNLTILNLSSPNITGKYLSKLTKLTHLSLGSCPNLESSYFIEICTSNKLQTLNINGCHLLDDNAFRILVETQADLYKIDLGFGYVARNIEIVAELKSLIACEIRQSALSDVVRCMTALAEHKKDTLEYLMAYDLNEFYDYRPLQGNYANPIKYSILELNKLKQLHLPCNTFVHDRYMDQLIVACPNLELFNIQCSIMISKEGILKSIKRLKYLRHLDITGCLSLDYEFYEKIYLIVKERNTFPLKLYFQNGEVHPISSFLTTMEYNHSKKYVEVVLEDVGTMDVTFTRKCKTKDMNILETPLNIKKKSTTYTPLTKEKDKTFMDLPEKNVNLIVSFLEPNDRLKLLLLHSSFHSLVANETLATCKIDLNLFSKTFTFNETLKILEICSIYLNRMHFIYMDGLKPIEYFKIVESFKKDFVEMHVDSHPENYFEDSMFNIVN